MGWEGKEEQYEQETMYAMKTSQGTPPFCMLAKLIKMSIVLGASAVCMN